MRHFRLKDLYGEVVNTTSTKYSWRTLNRYEPLTSFEADYIRVYGDVKTAQLSVPHVSGPSVPHHGCGELDHQVLQDISTSAPESGPNVTLRGGEQLLNTGLSFINETDIEVLLLKNYRVAPQLVLTPIDQERWRLAAPILKAEARDKKRRLVRGRNWLNDYREVNWEWPHEYGSYQIRAWIIFMTMGLIYGSIHLGAWNAPFRNEVEQRFWRISSSLVAGTGILLAILHLFPELFELISNFIHRSQANLQISSEREMLGLRSSSGGVNRSRSVSIRKCMYDWLERVCTILCAIIYLVLLTMYVAARAYLIVGCFLNLFHSQPEVFKQPSFSSYFPHFGSG
jgi:hypothetical protein